MQVRYIIYAFVPGFGFSRLKSVLDVTLAKTRF